MAAIVSSKNVWSTELYSKSVFLSIRLVILKANYKQNVGRLSHIKIMRGGAIFLDLLPLVLERS